MRSLRARITLLATVALVLVLATAAIVIVVLVERQLSNDLAAQNEATLAQVSAAIAGGQDPATIRLPLGTDGTEFVITNDGRFVQATLVVVTEDVLEPELTADDVIVFDPGFPFASLDATDPFVGGVVFVEDVLDQRFWDVTSTTAVAPDGEEYLVEAFTPTRVVDRSVDQVRAVLWIVIPALAVLFALLVWFLTGRTLRPVALMTDRANRIRSDTLHERLAEPGTDDEIGRLAATLNSMLERLDRGAQQQRRFVSDASHELKSPLTVMVGEAELAAGSRDVERLAEANERVVERGRNLTALIDDLLALARSDEAAFRRSEVDLDDVVRQQARLQPRDVDTSGVEPVRLDADGAALSRLVRNLLDNAARHANEAVAVTLTADADGAVLVVDDDGPGIAEHERDRVFERFARADEARTRATGGTGLGLAIVQAIAHGHGGTVEISTAPIGGARFTVRLPDRTP
ncbi:MAG: HAMP domain-containing sensor histidine kinase [Actinomycetota bacterium]